MSSADDADDERESPPPPQVEEWVDPKQLKFTVFVVLTNEEVCTVRDVPSGITVLELKGRLEILGGIPSQIYDLKYPDGEELADDKRLIVRENILHGYLLKVHIRDNWDTLHIAVTRNCIEQVYHSGGVHLKGNIHISASESNRFEGVVRERGTCALYMASFLGLQRMVNMLLSVGVNVNGTTLFGRTALHAAVARDRVAMADFLLKQGASLQKADCYGVIPIELAKQMSSTLCFRRLRLLQLNLRGNHGIISNRQTIKLDMSFPRPETVHADRAQSTLSQYSDGSIRTKSGATTPLHVSRRHMSSSAPLKDVDREDALSRQRTDSSLSIATTGKIRDSKRNVKWKDTKVEYTYLRNLNYNQKGTFSVEETVKVKPMPLAQPKAILKFSNILNSGSSQAKQNKQETGPVQEVEPSSVATDGLELAQAMKYSKQRLNYFKKMAVPVDDYVPMKDRKTNRKQPPTEVSLAFKNWLEKKTAEVEDEEENSTSVENFNETDSEEDKLFEFNKRVRKRNRDAVRNARTNTPVNRQMIDIMEFCSTTEGDGRNPPPEENMHAYKEWRKNKRAYFSSYPKPKSANDFILERRRLEEKRQRLLLNAISYDEWMDHTEERKMLIKQILRADQEEMKKLEDEKMSYRRRLFSYDVWKEKIEKREAEDKRRKEIQRKYEEERRKERIRGGKSTAAVPFDEWLKKKRLMMSKERNSDVRGSSDTNSEAATAKVNGKANTEKHSQTDFEKENYRWMLGSQEKEQYNRERVLESPDERVRSSLNDVQVHSEVTS